MSPREGRGCLLCNGSKSRRSDSRLTLPVAGGNPAILCKCICNLFRGFKLKLSLNESLKLMCITQLNLEIKLNTLIFKDQGGDRYLFFIDYISKIDV